MALTEFFFSPADGLRNKVSFPTDPGSEDNARDQVQDISDQIKDFLNGTRKTEIDAHMADLTAHGLTGSASRVGIINGNFDIAQRGTSFTNPDANSYTLDRMKINFSNTGVLPANIIHSQYALTPGDIFGSKNCYRIVLDGAGSGFGANDFYFVMQRIENGVRYLCGSGKSITVSFKCRTSLAGKKIGVYASQTYGSGGSPSATETLNGIVITPTSTEQTYTATFNTNTLIGKTFGTNNDDVLALVFVIMAGSTICSTFLDGSGAFDFGGNGTIDLAQFKVEPGSVATPFIPKPISDELMACQRYYEKSYDLSAALGTSTFNGLFSTGVRAFSPDTTDPAHVVFKANKRVAPTVTTYRRDGGTVNPTYWRYNISTYTAVTLLGCSEQGFMAYFNATASGLTTNNAVTIDGHWAADAEL